MKITRHARNNMRLYKIRDAEIMEALEYPDQEGQEGDRLIAIKRFQERFGGLPLKVVYKKADQERLIITAYPLKRKHWR